MVSQTTTVELKARDSLRPTATLCEVTETQTEAITLTAKAAEKIGELLGAQADTDNEGQALRVAVRGGGCSGFQYALAFDRTKEDDNVFEVHGVSVGTSAGYRTMKGTLTDSSYGTCLASRRCSP